MLPEIYEAIYRTETINWWFVSRHQLILDFFKRCAPTIPTRHDSTRVLDVGCGTGAMLEKMQARADAFGVDVSMVALHFCRQRGQSRLACANGTRLPYRDQAFGCLVSLDVIEHVADDGGLMRELHRVLSAGGVALITVPAHQWLWTTRDERLMHQRRYHRQQLIDLARRAGFAVEKCSYYCAFFFPALAAIVLLNRMLNRKPDVKQDVVQPAPLINAFLREVLLLEQRFISRLNLPFGVSLFCVLRKPTDDHQSAL